MRAGRRSSCPSRSATCFSVCDYRAAYADYELIAAAMPWPLADIKNLTVRERHHWKAFVIARTERE